jgi:hypothetical protein
MRPAIDIHGTHPADPLAAIMVEGDGLLALYDQSLVQYIEHLQERHLGRNAAHGIGLELTLVFFVLLSPHLEGEVHRIMFHSCIYA